MGGADGVEVRAGSIRLFFVWNGARMRETLTIGGRPLKPTNANVQHARRIAADIRKRLEMRTFVLAEFFPDSRRAEVVSNVTTFRAMCDLWLKSKGRCAPKTLAQYRNALKVWQKLFGAETPIAAIPPSLVESKVGDHPWASNKLLNNYLICLRGVFALAGRDVQMKNPTDGVGNGKHQATAPDPLSGEEMERVLRDLRGHYNVAVWAYFEFACMTGMRPEELIALKWGDVDWNHETIRVERAKAMGKIGPLKTYAMRDVDLVERAIEALKAMKPATFLRDEEIFYNSHTGRTWHDERSQRDHYWKPSLKRLGIRYRRAYQTRHTYATNALMAGVNPSYVSRQMGHANAKMLFTVYAKWIDGADRGREKAKMEEATKVPRESPSGHAVTGRRDWTRTNSRGKT